jgi:hypothetical protein
MVHRKFLYKLITQILVHPFSAQLFRAKQLKVLLFRVGRRLGLESKQRHSMVHLYRVLRMHHQASLKVRGS